MADACEQLNQRLKAYKEKLPDASFREVVNAAYFDRCTPVGESLGAVEFFIRPSWECGTCMILVQCDMDLVMQWMEDVVVCSFEQCSIFQQHMIHA